MEIKKILENLNELPGEADLIITSEPGFYTLSCKVRLKDKDTVIQSMSLTFEKFKANDKFEETANEVINDCKRYIGIHPDGGR